jgi:hypothetical protein
MPKNYNVYEGSGTVFSELNSNNKINDGDTITYQTNNQMGYEKYKVIVNKEGKKSLELIDDYDSYITPSRSRSRTPTKNSNKKGGIRRKTVKRRKTIRRKTIRRKN